MPDQKAMSKYTRNMGAVRMLIQIDRSRLVRGGDGGTPGPSVRRVKRSAQAVYIPNLKQKGFQIANKVMASGPDGIYQ